MMLSSLHNEDHEIFLGWTHLVGHYEIGGGYKQSERRWCSAGGLFIRNALRPEG